MVYSIEENTTEKVSWNLSMGIINEITYALQGASRYYIAGNPAKALYYLQTVRMRISANLDEEENNKLRLIEKDFMENIRKSSYRGFEQTEKQRQSFVKVCIIYTYYNDLIMSYLKKYGYLIPPKEDNTRLM
jgi:hypothetical protein